MMMQKGILRPEVVVVLEQAASCNNILVWKEGNKEQ
jgi:hypothetical protein